MYDWLCNGKNGEWVLILDNVDDAGFLFETRSISQNGQTNNIDGGNVRPLVSYIPRRPNGSILITSRSKNAVLKLVEQRNIIELEPMSKEDALMLFKNKLGGHDGDNDNDNDNDDEVTELVTALDFMPLAIVQAAAYISQRKPRYSVKRYLQNFRKGDDKRTRLLNYEGGQLRRDQEAKSSIIITWQISFDHISKIRQSAADLLALMSFFDGQAIPEILLQGRREQRKLHQDQKESDHGNSVNENSDCSDGSEDGTSKMSMYDELEEDIWVLRSFSFISVNANGTTFKMHALLQLAMRKWLQVHDQLERWRCRSIQILCAEFPTESPIGESENLRKRLLLYPHAKLASKEQPESADILADWALLRYRAAFYAMDGWSLGEAEELAVQSMEVNRKLSVQAHKYSLRSMDMVGLVLWDQERWDEAGTLQSQVIESRIELQAQEQINTLNSMDKLRSTGVNQEQRLKDTIQLAIIKATMKMRREGLQFMLSSVGTLALTYTGQGRWNDAEELLLRVMELNSEILGPEHPYTLISMANLAFVYTNQGRWNEAEKLHVQVMEISLRLLGQEHSNTLKIMSSLASTYKYQGRWADAEKLEARVVETKQRVLGQGHPSTLASMANLAETREFQNIDHADLNLME